MKRKILSVLCAATMLLSSVGMSVYADAAYKKTAEADFDTTISGLDTLTAESTKIAVEENGNKYLTASGYYALDYTMGNVIIDVRARFDGSQYDHGTITTRDGGSGNSWERTTEVRIPNTGWYYFRIMYDFENQTITTYRSANGWNDLQEISLTTKFTADTNGNKPAGIANIKFDRLQVDDIVIYQNGTAPTASVNVTRNGLGLTADYSYFDAEGDAEGATSIKWQVSSDGSEYTDIAGATAKTYTLTENESNKYVRCVVTPVSVRYPATGLAAESNVIECGEVKLFKEYIDEDFEGDSYTINIGTKTVDQDGDGTNTTKFLENSGNLDLSALNIPLDGTIVDFRAKPYTGNNFGITFIADNRWSATFPATFIETTDWYWYRFNFAVTNGIASYTVQKSKDRINWSKAALSTTSTLPSAMNLIYQIRVGKCYIDDFAVYTNGTAPTATATVTQDDKLLTAVYTYLDAEGDTPVGVKYQWQSSTDGVTYTNIEGATEATYTLVSENSGKYVRCAVTPVSTRYPAEGEAAESNAVLYKEYTTFVDEDFEGTEYDFTLDGTLTTDTENTSNYLVPSSKQQDIKDLKIPADETVIEVRAKGIPHDDNNNGEWFWINVIGDNAWSKQVGYAIDNGADTWKYYRMVITTGETAPIVKTYVSENRTEWTETNRGSVTGNLSEIIQIRLKGCAVDDIKVYKYGTAPTGGEAQIKRSGDIMSAGFDYQDAEGDAMGSTKYQWQRSADGIEFEDIENATANEYELGVADFNKYVRVQITPVSCAYPTDGEIIVSDAYLVEELTETKFGEIEYELDGDTLYISADVKAVEDETAVLIAAVFNGGTFDKVFLPEEILAITTNTTKIDATYDISAVSTGAEIKLMLWENMSSMSPLAGGKVFVKEQ